MYRMQDLFGGLSRRVRQHWPSRSLGFGHRAGDQWRGHLKSFQRDQNGAIAAISAVLLIVILGFGAFAIDMSYAYTTRNLLQVTASSAALAAAPELPNQGQAKLSDRPARPAHPGRCARPPMLRISWISA